MLNRRIIIDFYPDQLYFVFVLLLILDHCTVFIAIHCGYVKNAESIGKQPIAKSSKAM